MLARAYKLRELVDRATDFDDWLTSFLSQDTLNPLVRDEALRYLAAVDVHRGQLADASRALGELGFIRNWSIVESSAAAQTSPPAWRTVGPDGPGLWLDLADFYPFKGETVAYAASSVYSDSPAVVALRFGSDSPLALFVNETQLFSASDESAASFDQHAIPVALRVGWNPILLKLERRSARPWRFALRISRPEGGGLALRSSAGPATLPPETAPNVSSKEPLPPPDDLVERARAAATADPNSAEKLETLGLLEREHSRGAELEHLEMAARRSPNAERWLAVADSCADASCTFDALNAAVHSDSKSCRAKLAFADYYFNRNQLDTARDLLHEAIVLAPDDFVPRNRLIDLYVSAGLTDLALSETRELQVAFPGPLWLRARLASRLTDLTLFDEALALLQPALNQNFDGTRERELLARIYERRRDRVALQHLFEEELSLDPRDTASLARLSELYLGSGNIQKAEQMMRSAVDIKPDDDQLRDRYANLLARAGQSRAAAAQLARAVELNPHLETARLKLQLSSAQPSGSEDKYLEDPARLAAAADCAADASTNAIALADIRIERMYENGLASVRSQQIFCIANEQGAREYGVRNVQYAPASQQLRVLHARVYKHDGRVLEGVEAGEGGVADTSIAMYYDVRSREVRYPGLERGDVIELDYRVTPTINANPYGDYFASLVVFRASIPQALKRYVLIAPAGRKLNIVEERLDSPAAKSLDGTDQVYEWQLRDAQALANEPRGPSLTESAPYVHISTFGSWDEIGRWYADLIRPQFSLDTSLRGIAARLIAGKHSEIEKINAIHQFVLRNTHYVAMEFGIYSYKPYPVTQTYARRFGDCKDKASLMIALLHEAGVDADIALVRTRRLGDINQNATSVALFNHAIVFVPKWNLWLDGTAEYAGSRELPLEDQGAMALVVGLNGTSSLRRIPVTHPEDNYTRRSVKAQLLPDATLQFTGTAYTRGEDAPGLRRDYETAERQRDSFRSSLAEVFPSVHLEDVSVDGATDLERDVSVQFRGTLDTFAGRSVVPLATSWMPRSYVQTLAPLASRAGELVLPAPWTTEEELHFQLPAGATIEFVPTDTNLDTQFGSAHIRYRLRGRELVINTSVQFRQLRIAPAEYAAFRNFCSQVERAFRDEVKVRLRG
jgi:Tfp pilus assembly protein PilF/transglutaminase-like putative cysteine protease